MPPATTLSRSSLGNARRSERQTAEMSMSSGEAVFMGPRAAQRRPNRCVKLERCRVSISLSVQDSDARLAFVNVFVSLSRGAWINLFLALVIYGYLLLATTSNVRLRLKIVGLLALGCVMAAGVIVAAASSDQIAEILSQRASLDHTDHWRHFYVLMAIIWGLMAASRWTAPVIARRAPRLMRTAAARAVRRRRATSSGRRRIRRERRLADDAQVIVERAAGEGRRPSGACGPADRSAARPSPSSSQTPTAKRR